MSDILEKHRKKKERQLMINLSFVENGVDFIDLENTYVEEGARIGEGTVVEPCVTIDKETVIGKNCFIGRNTEIRKSVLGDYTTVKQSVINESHIGEKTNIGPFAYLRPGSKIGNKCKIGDFVEVKNSVIGDGSKASHLTYIGDSDIGKNVNLGCGVVFVNYDGKDKHRSTVGDGSFIGCNVNIISPININNNTYIAAGTTVTRNVPEGALSVGRAKEKVLEGWVERRGLFSKKSKE